MNIRRLDLNLLVLLDALISEASVTRAARRVHLSQPAMSSALNRLREVFQDPLLVRSATGMEPTRKAREIIIPVREALARVNDAIAPAAPAAPELIERTFTVAASEYVSFVVMPPLSRELEKLAPRVSLSVVKVDTKDPLEPLRSGDVDIVIAGYRAEGSYIRSRALFSDQYVCIARKRHPRIRGRLTLRQFIEFSQVVIRQQTGIGPGTLDEMFQTLGKSRKSAISLPDFLAVPHIIIETDHVMTVPQRVGRSLQKQFPLQVLAHPVRRKPFEVFQLWHQRSDADGHHTWLRDLIWRVSKELGS